MTKRDETLEMARLYRSGLLLKAISEIYGISKQAVQQRLASVGVTAKDRPPLHRKIEKDYLESLYAEKLTMRVIAEKLGVSVPTLNQALKLHRIPRRKSINTGGPRADVFRKLNIGDKCEEVFTHNKQPYVLIYTTARHIGIKVSTRSLGDGKFEITRIG